MHNAMTLDPIPGAIRATAGRDLTVESGQASQYDKLGNGKNLDGSAIGTLGNVTNTTNVALATPFALSVLLPPEVWNTITTAINVR